MTRLLLLLSVCCAISAPVSAADLPQLLFTSNRTGNFQIFLMNADGTGAKNLTNSASDETYPAWSPDGKKIAVQHHTDYQAPGTLHIMDADGSNVKEVIAKNEGPAEGGRPAWRPK